MYSQLKTDDLAIPAYRLLSLKRALAPMLPITLTAMCETLSLEPRRLAALRLVRDFFPEDLPNCLRLKTWDQILFHFLNAIRIHYFEIDEDSLELIDQWQYEEAWNLEEETTTGEPSEPESVRILAKLLEVIPVQCFGFGEESCGYYITDFPGLDLLHHLLMPGLKFSRKSFLRNFRIPLEIPPRFRWSEVAKTRAWQRLETPSCTDHLPEPLCWLPELARYACGRTDNALLKRYPAFYNWDEEGWYRWDTDFDLLVRLWPEAKCVADRAKRFDAWIMAQREERCQLIFNFITLSSPDLEETYQQQ
ncbi:MAG: hypothetical protein BroJett011_42140 [Chloroflexota bacterium]|nr:MAG: hypothetical protein BroJett011_42140 [Chloroflexota bacterium]